MRGSEIDCPRRLRSCAQQSECTVSLRRGNVLNNYGAVRRHRGHECTGSDGRYVWRHHAYVTGNLPPAECRAYLHEAIAVIPAETRAVGGYPSAYHRGKGGGDCRKKFASLKDHRFRAASVIHGFKRFPYRLRVLRTAGRNAVRTQKQAALACKFPALRDKPP